ncbi:hypothetical protein JOB18_005547 [Solea senegalensis]|uniref:Uncharacterized protein n=1 Tax=Solea senegalensis TaxID=28829 RepID=A0AAV6SMM9_SOLSE|nr:hypothetical protein JOB18_005547 [Solea senegalensis]
MDSTAREQKQVSKIGLFAWISEHEKLTRGQLRKLKIKTTALLRYYHEQGNYEVSSESLHLHFTWRGSDGGLKTSGITTKAVRRLIQKHRPPSQRSLMQLTTLDPEITTHLNSMCSTKGQR